MYCWKNKNCCGKYSQISFHHFKPDLATQICVKSAHQVSQNLKVFKFTRTKVDFPEFQFNCFHDRNFPDYIFKMEIFFDFSVVRTFFFGVMSLKTPRSSFVSSRWDQSSWVDEKIPRSIQLSWKFHLSLFSDIIHISLNLIDLIWARHFEATSARSGHFQPHHHLSLTFAVFSLSHCSLFNLQHLFSKLRKIFTTNNTTQHKTKKKQPKSQQLKKPTTKSRYIVYQFLLPLSLEAEGKTFLFFVKTFFTKKKHKFLVKETKRLQFLSSGRKKT